MIARRVMRHRCTIERNIAALDNHGAVGTADWQAHLSGVSCRAYYTRGQLQTAPQQITTIAQLQLMLPVGTDLVALTDRVGEITDLQGTVLWAGPLLIVGPLARHDDHLAVVLKEVG